MNMITLNLKHNKTKRKKYQKKVRVNGPLAVLFKAACNFVW